MFYLIRGIYIAASGMLAESMRADVVANNLANGNTGGFKKEFAVLKDFASRPIRRINDGADSPEIGTMGAGSLVDEVAVRHTQGQLRLTGNSLDFGLDGKGFFGVQTPAGIRYTRNGAFTRSAAGELVSEDGYAVIGQGGRINLDPAGDKGKVTADEDGRLFLDGVENNQFQYFGFADERRLIKEGKNLYRAPDGMEALPASPKLRQGTVELSNVNVVTEMVNMIAGYRAYETNAKTVTAHDTLLGKAVNDIART